MKIKKTIYVDDNDEIKNLIKAKKVSLRTINKIIGRGDGNYLYRYMKRGGQPMEEENYNRVKQALENYEPEKKPCVECGELCVMTGKTKFCSIKCRTKNNNRRVCLRLKEAREKRREK